MATSVNSATSGSSNLTSLSAKTGIAGLVSGLDTESIVQSMTLATRNKIAKQEASVTKLQWKQSSYRTVTKALKEFQSKYLDILASGSLRSSSTYSTVAASTTSSAVSVSATSGATAGNITIDNITQLATNQKITTGAASVSKSLTGETAADVTALLAVIDGSGVSKSFKLTLDGQVKTITMDAAFVTKANGGENFQAALQEKITAAFGESAGGPMVNVTLASDKLSFSTATSGSKLTVNALNSDTETLDFLGLKDGQTDKLNVGTALKDLPFANTLATDGGKIKFTINSVDFTFEETDSLSTVMSRVNSSTAGVTLEYSSISDKFTMTSKTSGVGDNIDISETGSNLMTLFGMTGANSVEAAGQNAILEVNGQQITRTSNSIEIDGVKVELLAESTNSINISKKSDTTALKDTIKNFVTDYNNMITMMNGLVKETKDANFQPLTKEQKAEMSETEIKDWEAKAKTGILSGDAILKSITSKMQTMMYGSAVEGGIGLYSIGITSAGYTENGKLVIDEEKLNAALETKGVEIQELFSKETTGLASQLNSVIDGAAKSTGVKGSRGTLVEMAGYESTTSDTENSITTSIKKMNETIARLKEMLKSEETRYWSKFTALESAMANLNVQSSMLTSFSAG